MDTLESKTKWRAFLKGDTKAYAWMYKMYVQDLYRFGLRFTSNKELVEDSIQDVFTNLYKGRHRLQVPDNVKVYLFVSLKNTLLRSLQKESAYESYDQDVLLFTLEPTVEENFIEKEFQDYQREQVKEILSLLTPRQQEVIYYRYVQEMSYEDIGVLMNLNPQSAQNLVQRSMKKIRENYSHIPYVWILFLQSLHF